MYPCDLFTHILGQWYGCPSADEIILKDMGKTSNYKTIEIAQQNSIQIVVMIL